MKHWISLIIGSFIAGFGYGAGREVFQYFRTERTYRRRRRIVKEN